MHAAFSTVTGKVARGSAVGRHLNSRTLYRGGFPQTVSSLSLRAPREPGVGGQAVRVSSFPSSGGGVSCASIYSVGWRRKRLFSSLVRTGQGVAAT